MLNENLDFALVRKASSAVEKAAPGAKRILSGMVADMVKLARDGRHFDEELQRAAEAGDSDAQFKLGQIHFNRRRYIRDRNGKQIRDKNWDAENRFAFQWFQMAADQGHAQAQRQLAFCYESGAGVDQNIVKAHYYLRLSGVNGCPEAWRNLGHRLIYETIHAKPNPHDGVECMLKAAKAGDSIAAFWLAKFYRFGRVRQYVENGGGYVEGIRIAPDAAESTRWLCIAAESNDDNRRVTEAQILLADCYLNGRGVSRDSTKAVMWYRKAAEALSRREHPYDEFGAARSLGLCYFHGQGVSQDLAEAYQWLKFGAEVADDEDAKVELFSLCKKISQGDLAEGENRFQKLQQRRKNKRFEA